MNKKRFFNIAGLLLGLLIIYFMIRKFLLVGSDIDWDSFSVNYNLFLVSVFLFILAYFIDVTAWKVILRSLDVKINFFKGLFVLTVSNMGKYVPGKVLSVIGRVGVDMENKEKVLFSVFIEMYFLSVTAFLFSFQTLAEIWRIPLWLVIIVLFLSIIPLYPAFINSILRILKRGYIWTGNFRENIQIFILYLISWSIKGMAFYFMIKSIYNIDINKFTYALGIFPLSWMIGFFAIIVPGGIGVREGIMSLGLSLIIPESQAILISLFSRIWIMIVEIMALLVSIIIYKISVKKG